MLETDKLIINYFVPFTGGKFVYSCIMLAQEAYPMIPKYQLLDRLQAGMNSWNQVEYSDIDFWWKDYRHDWFNTSNWQDYLSVDATTALENSRYVSYTCHDYKSVKHLKRIFKNAKILTVIPNRDLCKQNYLNKNWNKQEPVFEMSRIQKDLDEFTVPETDLIYKQEVTFDKDHFVETITDLYSKLEITLDLDLVLKYRELYLNSKFNK